MGKRRKRRGTAQHLPTHTKALDTVHTFHVLAYARENGTELAVCLDCDHREPWEKTK